jgi:hypothetical protein
VTQKRFKDTYEPIPYIVENLPIICDKRNAPTYWFGSKLSTCNIGPHGMEGTMEREDVRKLHVLF